MITWKQAFKVEQVPPAIVECLKKESFQKPDQKLFDATEKLLQNEEPEKKIFDKLKETAVRCWNDDPSKRPCADKGVLVCIYVCKVVTMANAAK